MLTGWNDINKMFEAMLLKGKLDDFYEDFGRSSGGWSRLTAARYYPRTNLTDEGDQILFVAEVPGIKKEDLQVKMQGNYLEISGIALHNVPQGYSVHRSERGATEFTRSFTLPADVDVGKVKADFVNGVLVLSLPKSKTAIPKTIEIDVV